MLFVLLHSCGPEPAVMLNPALHAAHVPVNAVGTSAFQSVMLKPAVPCRRPVVELLTPALVALGSGLEQWGGHLGRLGRSCAMAGGLAVSTIMGPPLALLTTLLQAVAQLMLPVWEVHPGPERMPALQSAHLPVDAVGTSAFQRRQWSCHHCRLSSGAQDGVLMVQYVFCLSFELQVLLYLLSC